jgi:hypothetical protein
MPKTLGDYDYYPAYSGQRDQARLHASVAIGASGAPTKSADSHSGIGITRSGAGTYSVTFPVCPVNCQVRVWASKTATVAAVLQLTKVPTSGTATFETRVLTGPLNVADPASGDILEIEIIGSWSK